MSERSAGVLLAVLLFGTAPARAEETGDDAPSPEATAAPAAAPHHPHQRYVWVTLENTAALLLPGLWYWNEVDFNRIDWDLKWDRESWKQKLITFEAVRFDTNKFFTNAVRHPLAGTVHYQMGRANGFGMLGSTAINLLASSVWEYVVEYNEYVSLNDIIMNTAAGISIGEPLLQLGRFGHSTSDGWAGRALASSASPFDAMHGWSAARAHRDDYTHRMELTAGVAESMFDEQTRRAELAVAAEIDLVGQPGYGRAGSQRRWTAPGAWNRIAVDLRLAGRDGEGVTPQTLGIDVRSQTTMFGHYAQSVADPGPGLDGSGRFLGVGAAFTYHRRRIAQEWDRLAIAHLAGPRIEVTRYRPTYTARGEASVYFDFAMVQALVFGPNPNVSPKGKLTSALAAEGYYYAKGLTVAGRAQLDAGPWQLAAELRAHQLWSIDGLDRHELDDPARDPHDIADQRLFGSVAASLRPGNGTLSIGVALQTALRRGTWADLERHAAELAVTSYVQWSL